jgi:hypothetical protein
MKTESREYYFMPYNFVVVMAVALLVGWQALAEEPNPLLNGKSPESAFLIGAWRGYMCSLGTNQDSANEYRFYLAQKFQKLQMGLCESNTIAELDHLFQESLKTQDKEFVFKQVQEVALSIERAFFNDYGKPTMLVAGLTSGNKQKGVLDSTEQFAVATALSLVDGYAFSDSGNEAACSSAITCLALKGSLPAGFWMDCHIKSKTSRDILFTTQPNRWPGDHCVVTISDSGIVFHGGL